eukprot:1137010-Pelagomonas_calceolata.AAC.2
MRLYLTQSRQTYLKQCSSGTQTPVQEKPGPWHCSGWVKGGLLGSGCVSMSGVGGPLSPKQVCLQSLSDSRKSSFPLQTCRT